MPCVHNFCGGCFSDWIFRSNDCPTCRNPIDGVSKSAVVNSLIENFLAMNPDKKREEEVLQETEKKNIFMKKISYSTNEIK